MSSDICAAQERLLPCPFCGSEATLEDQRLMWVARCTSCSACVLGDRAPEPEQELPESYWEPFRQSAVDCWNRRPAAPPAPENRLLWSWETRSDGTPPAPKTQPAPPAPEVWDGPSLADVDELCAEFGFHYDDTQGESLEILQQMVAAAITRWRAPAAQPATPPAPEVGEQHVSQPYKLPEPGEVAEVGELADRLGWIAAQLGDIGWSDDAASVACAATLLSQLSAPAPAAEPVAPQTGDSSTITPQP